MWHQTADIRQNGGRILIHPEARVEKDVWLDVGADGGEIIVEKGAHIGRRSVIGAGKSVRICKNALLGPNVYIADIGHLYEDISRPISWQGATQGKGIVIGEGCWLGINSAIMSSVGKNSVVAANAVVTKPVPDYTVVAGVPAVPIKKYDFKKKKWVKVRKKWFNLF